jgi:hypothetical protein
VPVDAGALISCELRGRIYRRSSSPRAPGACRTESSFCAPSPHPMHAASTAAHCATRLQGHVLQPRGRRACKSGDMLRALPIASMRNRARAPGCALTPCWGILESPHSSLGDGHTGQVRTWAEGVRRRGCPTRGAAPANLKRQTPSGPPHDPHAHFSRASSPGACAVRDRQVRLGRDAPTPRPGPFYTAHAATPRTPVCAPQRGWGASLGPHHCWVRMPFELSTPTSFVDIRIRFVTYSSSSTRKSKIGNF